MTSARSVPPPSPTRTASRPQRDEAGPLLQRWLSALERGGEAWWWPPRARLGEGGLLEPARAWRGAADAARLREWLADPRLRAWRAFLAALERDCAALARRHAARVAPAALALDNGDLHAPVVLQALRHCLAPRRTRLHARLQALRDSHRRFLELFLRRLRRDGEAGALGAHGRSGAAVALWAHPEETHNGRQRVLRVEFERGGALAYKPRPADAEIAFLAARERAGVFAAINALPAAAGPVRLPTLDAFHGAPRARDRGRYLWQEWIEPPPAYRRIRGAGRGEHERATVLAPRAAARLWRRAGNLAAACFGFGLVDLGPGNVLAGEREGETVLIPVDLEICLFPVRRLEDTGLVVGERDEGSYAPGLERAGPAQSEGPALAWLREDDRARLRAGEGAAPAGAPIEAGGWRLCANQRPWRRRASRTLVRDRAGAVGYAAYLPGFLRGMFDAWMLLHLNSERVADELRGALRGGCTRVLLRPTADYLAALDAGAFDHDAAADAASARPFNAAERRQLARGDVPYFFRQLRADAPLLALSPPPQSRLQRVPLRGPQRPPMNPAPELLAGPEFAPLDLCVALRDAVAHALADPAARLPVCGERADARLGVRLRWWGARDGEAAFDWPAQDRRLVYRWEGESMHLRIEAMSASPACDDEPVEDDALDDPARIAERLLRIDRIDAALRAPWTASGFADAALDAQLRERVDVAMAWLQRVVARHGWPGQGLVGAEAAAAACRLLQHADGPRAFQDRCLRLVERAARDGDMSLRELAYLTDALRVQRGRKQRFGTKFRRRGAALEPCPIEQPAQVDARRRAMGLEPLADYARRVRSAFEAAPA
ncbi:DUF6624 domain-containing protein [Lysobacter enzymogenes]|uniref:DUF4135 domain-containing protein n=1 Tax=Lysobacter enzymogenes TaxID=69 RepID=A0A3N2RLN2_LYSEN|nr:DUF6624 domain-containing protein [Lysobacter enzymogenes]ROU08382.1 DUF4135 domain-containing protein [Lysobacter enzymogenes]